MPLSANHGWRIPATEIENNLASALSKILRDRKALVRDLPDVLDVAKIGLILETAEQWSARFHSEEQRFDALASLVERVEIGKAEIRLSISSAASAESPIVDSRGVLLQT